MKRMFAITKKQATVLAAVAIFAAVMFVVPMAMSTPSHQASACGWGGGWGGGCGGCWSGCGGWGGWGWHHHWGGWGWHHHWGGWHHWW